MGKGEKAAPSHYTIKEEAVYNIVVKELVDGKWVGFNGKDMQMEFVRIDPFVRITMENKGQGKMEGNFKVNYHRVGYTRVYETTQISVVPLRHNEYERFIVSAFPYYASAFSMMAGVCIFSFVFLHFKEEEVKKKTE